MKDVISVILLKLGFVEVLEFVVLLFVEFEVEFEVEFDLVLLPVLLEVDAVVLGFELFEIAG